MKPSRHLQQNAEMITDAITLVRKGKLSYAEIAKVGNTTKTDARLAAKRLREKNLQ